MLCYFVHTSFFQGLPYSLSLSLSASFFISPLPSPFPTGDLFFSCGIWDPIHWERIIRFLSIPEDGPRAAEWVTLSLSLSPYASPTLYAFLAMKWCHGFYFLRGYTSILSLYYTLCISLIHPLPSITFSPVLFPDSFASHGVPEDLGIFGCCLAHPRYMLNNEEGKQSACNSNCYFHLDPTDLTSSFYSHISLKFTSAFSSLQWFRRFCCTPSLWNNHQGPINVLW